jgi:hypothetical protein
MSLVDDNVFKREFLESRLFDETDLIGRDADFKILRYQPIADDFRSLFFRTREKNDVKVRCPLCEFSAPVLKRDLGYND